MKYIKQDPVAGRLIYRRAFPAALRPFLPGEPRGPREMIRTLKARSIAEPGAYALYEAANAEYDRMVDEARKAQEVDRKKAAGVFDELDADLIRYLIGTYVSDALTVDDEVRWMREPSSTKLRRASNLRATTEGDLAECRALRATGDLEGITAIWSETARGFAEDLGFNLDAGSEPFSDYVRAFNDANIHVWEALLHRLDGKEVETPSEPKAPEPPEVRSKRQTPDGGLKSFQAIAESVLGNKRLDLGHATVEGSNTALRFFREVHGLPVPVEITKAMVSTWLDLLAQRPSRPPKADMSRPLPELIEKYQGRTDVPRLTPRTLEKHLTSMSALWTKAQGEGQIDEALPNPFKRKVVTATVRVPKSKGIGTDTMHAIFSLPIFTAGERPRGGKGEASYWLPLLLLWTGCRPEEAAQLMVDDIGVDPDTGDHTIRFTDEGVHPYKGPRLLKTSKRQSGRRTIPIPKPLLDLNFLAYVQSIRDAKEVALFPQLRVKGARKLLFASFSVWWGKYLRDHGVRPEGDEWRPAREFRHVWATAARQSRIPREAMEYIQGHKNPTASSNDDYGQTAPLGEYLDGLQFRGLDLSKVLPWRKQSETRTVQD